MKNWSRNTLRIAVIISCIFIIFSSSIISSKINMNPLNNEAVSLHSVGEEFGNFDSYADSVIEQLSKYFLDSENALGETDGNYARIFSEYGAGYITFDMGRYEEILDGVGEDFTVVSTIGYYTCWVGNFLEAPFIPLGNISTGTTSFDLSLEGFDFARYVRIQYYSGVYVNLDSIEAIYHNMPEEDTENPVISGPVDFWIWDNQSNINLIWQGSDSTPFKYIIFVNLEEIETGEWGEDDISFTYFWDEKITQNVTLTLYDIYGNQNTDSVIIEILDTPVKNTGSNLIILLSSVIGIVVVSSIFRKLNIR